MRVENALDSWLLDYRWGMTPKEYDFVHHVDAIIKSVKKNLEDGAYALAFLAPRT